MSGVFSGVATSDHSSSSTRLGTFHLALEALGLGVSSCAGQAQDLLVVVHHRVEQFLAEYSRLLSLEHLQYHALIAEGCVLQDGLNETK